MKVFVIGIALACAGTGLTQWALTHQHVQVQAAPSSITAKPKDDVSGQPDSVYVPKTIPFDAATYNMNSMGYKSVDSGDDPAKLWDESSGSTARSAEGWDGTSPEPSSVATAATSGAPSAAVSGAYGSSTAAKSGATASAKQTPAKTAKPPIASATPARVPQGTKGALASPQTLSQGPTVKPVKVPLY